MMKKLMIVTGANGHLGSTVIRLLQKMKIPARGLILPGEKATDTESVQYFRGDVRDPASLEPLFAHTADTEITLIHTAGIVDISGGLTDSMFVVNVLGTQNIIDLCLKHHVKRLVYVSSVHAIPESGALRVLHEVEDFSPELVVGGYAKTKAEATRRVLLAVREQGLNAVVVHPSGILGPYSADGNHLVQLVSDYLCGKLPACVTGGYDLVDVRDVAQGCLAAAEKGRAGDCYILSNRHYEIRDVLKMVKGICGGRRLPTLPIWMAKAGAPLLGWIARRRKERPLYTAYSLHALKSNDRFSHDKATSELNYRPRDLAYTIYDTVHWLLRTPKTAAS